MAVKNDVMTALTAVADPAGGGTVVETGRAAGVVVKDDGTVGLVLAVTASTSPRPSACRPPLKPP